MAAMPILVYPDERLRQLSVPVTAFDARLRQFLTDLADTMRASPSCVGLAAPQLGYFERIVMVDVSVSPRVTQVNHGCLVLINPEVVWRDGEAIGREGCLSVPDFTGNVVRAEHIRVNSRTPDGGQREYVFDGFEARAVQHEIDHLDGLLFLDRLSSQRDLFRRKVYK
jgi:peptide deformylase